MKQKGNGDNPWRAAGLVGVMGLDIALCIYLGYFLGSRFGGTPGWVVLGILSGLAVGILSSVIIIKKALGGTDG
ncbi:AtpZ/AtpI family protein [Paenibacillus tarimensis]